MGASDEVFTAGRSGMDWLQAALAGELPPPPAVAALGFRLVVAGDGLAVFECEPSPLHMNGMGAMHGGVICTLADSAGGCAVLSVLPPGMVAPTQDIKVSFLRPITPDTGAVRAEGRVLHSGRRTALAEVRMTDRAGQLMAHATVTCAMIEWHGAETQEVDG
jgi:uncharacterized protein (TIGR00369 family)